MCRKIVAILQSVLIITQSSKLEIKNLGVIFDDLLKFDSQINARVLKASKFSRIFSKLRHLMPLFWLNLIYKAIVWPQMICGCEVWGYRYEIYLKKLEVFCKIEWPQFWHFQYLVIVLFIFLLNLSGLNSLTLLLLIKLNSYSKQCMLCEIS